jgi:hypothetical protein
MLGASESAKVAEIVREDDDDVRRDRLRGDAPVAPRPQDHGAEKNGEDETREATHSL